MLRNPQAYFKTSEEWLREEGQRGTLSLSTSHVILVLNLISSCCYQDLVEEGMQPIAQIFFQHPILIINKIFESVASEISVTQKILNRAKWKVREMKNQKIADNAWN